MPLDINNSLESFKYLKPEVKNKAIGIANALIKIGLDSSIAELVAVSNAKLWACFKSSETTAGAKSPHVHLIPHPSGWALISEDASFIYFTNSFKKDALNKARSIAKNDKLKLFIHSPVGNIHDSESFVVNRPIICGPEVHSIPVKDLVERTGKNGSHKDNNREMQRDSRWLSRNPQARQSSNNSKENLGKK